MYSNVIKCPIKSNIRVAFCVCVCVLFSKVWVKLQFLAPRGVELEYT